MTDNDLIKLFLPIINAGLVVDGYSGVVVKQANQPTQQGINTGPTVYFFKLGDKRFGFLGRHDVWNPIDGRMDHEELQYYETTFQFNALVTQNPKVTNSYTASDLLNEVASIMQSDAARDTLMQSGVGILRITDLVNPYFVDDRDQFEASPSFTFTLTYKRSRLSVVPVISGIDVVINGV